MPEFRVERKLEDATWIYHKIVSDQMVGRDQVMAYIEEKQHFGYNPAGYSGFLIPLNQAAGTKWTWKHYSSCD